MAMAAYGSGGVGAGGAEGPSSVLALLMSEGTSLTSLLS